METLLHASYKARGLYARQLATLLEHYPPGRILVLGSGALRARPDETVREVFAFLGLPLTERALAFPARNVGKNRSDVPDRLLDALRDHFAPHNEQLFALLGRRPDW